jgi:hypothetical protein
MSHPAQWSTSSRYQPSTAEPGQPDEQVQLPWYVSRQLRSAANMTGTHHDLISTSVNYPTFNSAMKIKPVRMMNCASYACSRGEQSHRLREWVY